MTEAAQTYRPVAAATPALPDPVVVGRLLTELAQNSHAALTATMKKAVSGSRIRAGLCAIATGGLQGLRDQTRRRLEEPAPGGPAGP